MLLYLTPLASQKNKTRNVCWSGTLLCSIVMASAKWMFLAARKNTHATRIIAGTCVVFDDIYIIYTRHVGPPRCASHMVSVVGCCNSSSQYHNRHGSHIMVVWHIELPSHTHTCIPHASRTPHTHCHFPITCITSACAIGPRDFAVICFLERVPNLTKASPIAEGGGLPG
jgi:hypothetical protein